MFLLAVGGMSRVQDQENSFKASSWANTCAEDALNKIRNDPNYIINNIFHGDGTDGCNIYETTIHGNNIITFKALGIFSEYRKTIQIDLSIEEDVAQREIIIVGWSEELEILD